MPGRTVYIGLRQYDPTIRRMRNCRGFNVRAFGFTPDEVQRIIVDALRAASIEFQRLERARKALE